MEGTQPATKSPTWLRAVEIAFGLVAISLSVLAIIYPGGTLLAIAFLFSFALLVIGFAMIGSGFDPRLSGGLRALNLVVGFLAIPFAFLALIDPTIAVLTALFFLAFFLMIRGIGGIAIAVAAKGMPGWLRGVMVVAGILAIIIAFLALIYPLTFGLNLMIILFAIALVVIGVELLVAGATGAPMRKTVPGMETPKPTA